MLVDTQSDLLSDLLFTVHKHGGDDVTWKPPIYCIQENMVALNINTAQGKDVPGTCSDIVKGKSKGPTSKYGGTMEDRKTASELSWTNSFQDEISC